MGRLFKTKTLEELAYNTNVLKALDPQQRSNSLDGRAVILKDDRGKTFTVDNDMIAILIEMGEQTNNQFQLISVDANSNKILINGVDVSLVPDGIKMKCKVGNTKSNQSKLIRKSWLVSVNPLPRLYQYQHPVKMKYISVILVLIIKKKLFTRLINKFKLVVLETLTQII